MSLCRANLEFNIFFFFLFSLEWIPVDVQFVADQRQKDVDAAAKNDIATKEILSSSIHTLLVLFDQSTVYLKRWFNNNQLCKSFKCPIHVSQGIDSLHFYHFLTERHLLRVMWHTRPVNLCFLLDC